MESAFASSETEKSSDPIMFLTRNVRRSFIRVAF
jgi:hypothetical protein